MPYAQRTVYQIKKGPRNLGNMLGRAAVDIDFSVQRVSELTGATRQTVYNWMFGGDVLSPYRALVARLTETLKSSENAEQAWTRASADFAQKV